MRSGDLARTSRRPRIARGAWRRSAVGQGPPAVLGCRRADALALPARHRAARRAAHTCGSSTPAAGPRRRPGPMIRWRWPGPARRWWPRSARPTRDSASPTIRSTAPRVRRSRQRRSRAPDVTTGPTRGPTALEAPCSGRYRDIDPALTPGGTRLYFNSDRPTSGITARGDFDLWALGRSARWADPVRSAATSATIAAPAPYRSTPTARSTSTPPATTCPDLRARPTADSYGLPDAGRARARSSQQALEPVRRARSPAFLIYVLDPGRVGARRLVVTFRRPTAPGPRPSRWSSTARGRLRAGARPTAATCSSSEARRRAAPADGRPPGDIYPDRKPGRRAATAVS
ncbi:MAG: PD40 domain-containing protein [Myxococcales bacterium]|nr:PD40 domain-containing protein [Myxococcales bacterium]